MGGVNRTHPAYSAERAGEWTTEADAPDVEVLDAVRRFVSERGQLPNQDSWTAASMSPCERTVRNRFGSFRAAADAAGVRTSPR